MYVQTPDFRQLSFQDLCVKFYMNGTQAKMIAEGQNVFFFEHVTKPLLENESIFAPLFNKRGRPATSPALVMSAWIYADRYNIPDRKLIEDLWTDSNLRRALGMDGIGPFPNITPWKRKTQIGFRRRCADYLRDTGIDVVKKANELIRDEYMKEMNITMDTLRTDTTLIEANIKVVSRNELVFQAIRVLARDMVRTYPEEQIKSWGLDVEVLKKYFINKTFQNQLTYYGTMTNEEIRAYHLNVATKIFDYAEAVGEDNCPYTHLTSFKLMLKVFTQQCYLLKYEDTGKQELRFAKPGEPLLKPSNIQSLYDLDAAFREKGDVRIRGYVFSTVEAIDKNRSLYVDWSTHPATKSDIAMLKEYVEMLPDVCPLSPKDTFRRIIADAAYYSEELRKLCLKKGYKLIATDMTGKPGNSFLGQFGFSEETMTIGSCPAGETPDHCAPVNKQGQMKAYMGRETCDKCPHRQQCCALSDWNRDPHGVPDQPR